MGLHISQATTAANLTFSLGATDQSRLFFQPGFSGTFNSEVSSTNKSSYTLYKNGAAQGGFPWSFVDTDEIYIDFVRTTPGSAADVVVNTTGIDTDITHTSDAYYQPVSTDFIENMAVYTSNGMSDSYRYYQGDNGGTGYNFNLISDNTTALTGEWEIIIPPFGFVTAYTQNICGANDDTVSDTVANRYPRIRYAFFCNIANSRRCYELGTVKSTVGDSYCGHKWLKIKGVDLGADVGEVKYYFSADNMATWTLEYTSTDNYSVSTDVFRLDHIVGNLYYGIIPAARMVQL